MTETHAELDEIIEAAKAWHAARRTVITKGLSATTDEWRALGATEERLRAAVEKAL